MKIHYWATRKSNGRIVYLDDKLFVDIQMDPGAKEAISMFLAEYPDDIFRVFRQSEPECVFTDYTEAAQPMVQAA